MPYLWDYLGRGGFTKRGTAIGFGQHHQQQQQQHMLTTTTTTDVNNNNNIC